MEFVSGRKQINKKIITNIHTELKPQENVSHNMSSPAFTVYPQP